mmetsp:Transcript_20819/g.31799  ORF Transcript_20819/g.31799 Transcript_20819/m.31799 type:complete len:92 (-) Transcript_20819:108-383(-)
MSSQENDFEDADGSAMIRLNSQEEEEFELTLAAAKLSELVRESIEDDTDSIHIIRVSSDCLRKVVAYLKKYHKQPMKDISTPLGANSFEEV